jgi:F-type H+-transporting ATPase subunit b
MLGTAEFWVLASFVIFIGLVVYLGVPGKIMAALDARSAKIRDDLAEAQRLREEAQALLAEAQRKQREAEQEAVQIVNLAREDAKVLAAETRKKLDELLERRRQMAELKIKQAEEQAIKDVRSAAAELAVAAATEVIAKTVKGPQGAKLVDQSIDDLRARLH